MIEHKNCEYCGKEFTPKKAIRRFCSNKCSSNHRNIGKVKIIKCDYCGKEFQRPICHISKKNYCSILCRNKYIVDNKIMQGDTHPSWNGGVSMQEGYLCVRIGKGKYKQVHREVLENAIGRKLSSEEIVHHIDENKLNNALNNLKIVTRAEHINIHREALQRGVIEREVKIYD